jgi:hypothetical protein
MAGLLIAAALGSMMAGPHRPPVLHLGPERTYSPVAQAYGRDGDETIRAAMHARECMQLEIALRKLAPELEIPVTPTEEMESYPCRYGPTRARTRPPPPPPVDVAEPTNLLRVALGVVTLDVGGAALFAHRGLDWFMRLFETNIKAVYVSQNAFGKQWPLTVSAGVLVCDRSSGAVLFETGGERYALNERAQRLGLRPIDSIQQTAGPLFRFIPLSRLPEPERRRAFRRFMECRDHRSSTPPECDSEIAEQYRLTRDELGFLLSEGTALRWPPLSAVRASLFPLVMRGSELCEGR